MKIKLLPKKDLKKFWKMQKQYLDEYTFDYVEKDYKKNKTLYIGAYNKDRLIGIAYGHPSKNVKSDIVLQGITVNHIKTYSRKGTGSKILNFFENQVKKLKKKSISLGSAEGYVEKFYLKNNYKPIELVIQVGKNKLPKNYKRKYKIKGEKEDKKYKWIRMTQKNYDSKLQKELKKYFNAKEVIYIFKKKI
jgi:hypothetical protein